MFKKLANLTILISIFFFCLSNLAYGQSANELKSQINDINNQIKALDKEIAEYKGKIAKTSEEAKTLANMIKELTLTRNKLLAERTSTEKKIKATGLVIKELSGNIETKEESIKKSKESISEMIYLVYQNEQESLAETILSQKDFESMSREYNNQITLSDKLKKHIFELTGQKEELNKTKAEKLDEQDKLTDLKKTLLEKEKAVTITQNEKNKILTETKNKESEYQKILAERQKLKESFEKEVEDYENQLELLINPELLPKKAYGILLWPLNDILITSNYGERWGSFHHGIDFRASIGTSVMAMGNGVVMGVGDTDISCPKASFGKWIFIKYNNGISSTYGHLSKINVKKGQKVKGGEIVGLSGNTGSSTGPHLHISTYASDGVEVSSFDSKSCKGKTLTQPMITKKDAHINPLLYLPRTTKSMYKDGVL